MNITYRFKFSKGEGVKFIGHLDVLKAFQRALKRADLPIAYSQGFNPHQLISFASPLSLGYTSEGEYGDFKLTEFVKPEIVMEKLNNALPNDMKAEKIILLKDGVKNTMSSVCAAEYEAYFDMPYNEISKNIQPFLNQEKITVMKKTKKGLGETDIKPDIIRLWPIENGLGMLVNAGSVRNLKPESVAEGYFKFLGLEFNKYKMAFKRIDLLMDNGSNVLVPLTEGVDKNEKDFG
ncbi:TIGR03936 family radical SAM-associated protein [Anaerotignum faecicola]|nr:TIGR03936 family radical SAM-associated protein [Anaerotignum faecicola]